MGSSVEQQISGKSATEVRPRSRPRRTAPMTDVRTSRHVFVATRPRPQGASSVGGCAAQQSRAGLGTGHCISTTVGAGRGLSAQPDVRADVRHAGGHGSTVR